MQSADQRADAALAALLSLRDGTRIAENESLCQQRPPFGLMDTTQRLQQLLVKSNPRAFGGHALANTTEYQLCAQLASIMRRPYAAHRRLQSSAPLVGRCAVVGSGGGLHGSNLGALIDLHDRVIRFNAAPPLAAGGSPFSADVGRNTHVRVATHAPWRHHRREGYMHKNPMSNLFLYCHNGWLGVCHGDIIARYGAIGAPVHAVDPTFIRHVADLVHSFAGPNQPRRAPSTGLLGLALALVTCDEVSAFGFGNTSEAAPTDSAGAEMCDHYWECRVPSRAYFFDRSQRFTHDWAAQWRLMTWLGKRRSSFHLRASSGGLTYVRSSVPPSSSARRNALRRAKLEARKKAAV